MLASDVAPPAPPPGRFHWSIAAGLVCWTGFLLHALVSFPLTRLLLFSGGLLSSSSGSSSSSGLIQSPFPVPGRNPRCRPCPKPNYSSLSLLPGCLTPILAAVDGNPEPSRPFEKRRRQISVRQLPSSSRAPEHVYVTSRSCPQRDGPHSGPGRRRGTSPPPPSSFMRGAAYSLNAATVGTPFHTHL